MIKTFLITFVSLSICFSGCDKAQNTNKTSIESTFEMIEKQTSNPLPIIANIILKIDKIPKIESVESSLDSTQIPTKSPTNQCLR